MLLPLLGACAVVGPFQGPEWEPVRGLLSQDHSCRDPRCCGNLLVFCLFLIWQVRHYWCHVTRTRPSKRNIIKVLLKKWVVPSTRHEIFFRMTAESEFLFSPGKFRGLDTHVQQWENQTRLQQPRVQHLLSPQHQRQDLPWGIHTRSEPIFCTSSFLSTCLQNSSWESWRVPWCLRDRQTHPGLDLCLRMEQLLVHSQEKWVPLEPVVNMRSHPTSMTLAISLPNLPSAQRLQFCIREFLPNPSNQQLGMTTWKSWDSPQEACAPWDETQTVGREYSGETQAPQWANQRERRGEDAWDIQASWGQLPICFRMEDGAEAKALGCRNQIIVVSETDRETLTPRWENQDQTEPESGAQIEELWKENQKEAGDKNPLTQTHMGENQEQCRYKIDAETQTPEWGNQDKSAGEDVVENQAFEKNEKEDKGKEGEEIQGQGLGKQGRTGGENGEESWKLERGKQDQIGGDIGVEIEPEEGRNKDHVEGGDAVQTQTYGRENLGKVKQEDNADTQTLESGQQGCIGSENIAEIQTPEGKNQGWAGSEKAGKTQASRGENQNLSRQAIHVGWGNQGLERGENVGDLQISRRKTLREIREEEWVVIQVPLWGNQRLVVSKIYREFKITCWGNQNQVGGEHRAETQAPEESDQRKDGNECGTNTLAPEAESQGQLGGKTDVETHPSGMNHKEQFRDENGTDIQAVGKINLRGVKGEDGTEYQELGEENQGQLRNEFHERIHISKWENQQHIRGNDGANTQTCEVDNWGKLTSNTDGEKHSAGWKIGEQAKGEYGAEIQRQGMRIPRGAGREDGTETRAAREGSQSQLGNSMDRKNHLSEWNNQEETGGEDGREIHAPEKRSQRELGGEDGIKMQKPERENQGQLESEIGGNPSPRRRSWEQTGGENASENQASEKRKRRKARSEDGRKIHGLRSEKQRLLRSETCSSEWKAQEHTGCGNGTEIQIQGKRNQSGTTGDYGPEFQASVGDYQGQSRGKTDGEIQTQHQGNQNKSGDEDAAEIQHVGSQRKYRAEDAGGSRAPKRRDKDQVRGKDAARARLQGDCCGDEVSVGRKCSLEQPSALTASQYGALGCKQAMAINSVASAPCPEMKPHPLQGEVFLLASGEGKHLASQGMAPAQQHKARASPVSQQARPGSRRRHQRDKRAAPGKASSLTGQPQNPQYQVRSICPSAQCGQAPQAAAALTSPPKGAALKKSKRQLLESLMRRRTAHLRWGLPRRVLESYLFFNLLGSCSPPLAGVRLPGLCTDQELQRQQKRHREAQSSTPGLKSPERSQSIPPTERKSSKLPTQARVLEKCQPHRSEPASRPIPPEKPRRIRPPGGVREPQIQKKAPMADIPAPRSPRPSSNPRSWYGPEGVPEPSRENSKGRKMIRPGVSQTAEGTPSRVRTTFSRAGHDSWKKEHTSWEASEPPTLKCQRPTFRRRGSLESTEGRRARWQPSSYSTDTATFKGSVHSAAAKLSVTLLSKMPWSPQRAKLQHSASNLTLRDPTLLPKVGAPHSGEDSIGVHAALERDVQPPGDCCAGVALPRTESCQGQGSPGNPNGAPRNPPAPQKFSFMKNLRRFLFQSGFKK